MIGAVAGTPFAPTEMDCGRNFQRRAGWQKFKQNVGGINKSECELEVTTLMGPAVTIMGPTSLALQQSIDDCLGYGRQQKTTLGTLFGQQFDASILLPRNAVRMLTYFRQLIARGYNTDAVAVGDEAVAAKKAEATAAAVAAAAKKDDSSSSSSSSDSDSDDDAGASGAPKPRALSDPRLIRGMFTRLLDNPGILRRTMVTAWEIWKGRKPKQVDLIGADAFSELDRDGGGTVDAEEFRKFFEGEDEATRLERVFDTMVIKAFPLLPDEAVLHQAMLTAQDNATGLAEVRAESAHLLAALTSEDALGKEFQAYGGSVSLIRDEAATADDDDGAQREEVPFNLADVNPYTT